MSHVPSVTLIDGARMPRLGFGTLHLNDIDAIEAVGTALDTGFRMIDTSTKFGNEVGIGLAITASSIPRDQLTICLKLDGSHLGGSKTGQALARSLDRLGLDYVDQALINYPLPHHENFVSTWVALAELQSAGLARSIGLSEFSSGNIDALVAASGIRPAVVQSRLNPLEPNRLIRADALAREIELVAGAPLGERGSLLQHPVIRAVAAEHDRSPAQIALRWVIQHEYAVLVRSRDAAHLAEDLQIFDFELTPDAMVRLDALGAGATMDHG